MPAHYTIDKDRRLVMSTAKGAFTMADALTHGKALLQDPDFDPSFSQLFDLTQITEWKVEPDEVRRFAQYTVFSAHSRRAFLVASDLVFGYMRMFEMLRDSRGEEGIRVFRNRDEAMAWALPNHSAP